MHIHTYIHTHTHTGYGPDIDDALCLAHGPTANVNSNDTKGACGPNFPPVSEDDSLSESHMDEELQDSRGAGVNKCMYACVCVCVCIRALSESHMSEELQNWCAYMCVCIYACMYV